MIVLVTGASGFIGSALVRRLVGHPEFIPRGAVRRADHHLPLAVEIAQVSNFPSENGWDAALKEVDVVVHLAGRAHVLAEVSSDPLEKFRKVNVGGTLTVARQAVAAGVKRFIFISSIGVNGNENNRPFTENCVLGPVEPYAVSKMEAEAELLKLSEITGLEVVIIRPPLVYGPNAPGNFGRLIRAIDKGTPLPLGAVKNKRSMVALDNLVDLIVTCMKHPAAANQTFLAGDGEDLSTTELLRRVGHAIGKPSCLIPVPTKLLEFGAMLIGKRTMAQRLCGSLQVDISKARELLGWNPPISVDEGLKKVAESLSKCRVGLD